MKNEKKPSSEYHNYILLISELSRGLSVDKTTQTRITCFIFSSNSLLIHIRSQHLQKLREHTSVGTDKLTYNATLLCRPTLVSLESTC